MATFTDWVKGQQALSEPSAHWFGTNFVYTSAGTDIVAAYTNDYNNGKSPWIVTIDSFVVDSSGNVTTNVSSVPYTTGYNFRYEPATLLAKSEYVLGYDSADPNNTANGVDIYGQFIDASGSPIGTPVKLLADVVDLTRFEVSGLASGGTTFDVVYSTLVPGSGVEQVRYQVFNANGTAVAGESGTIENINTTSGEFFEFGTLVPSTGTDPSYIYVRGSGFGLGEGNIGLKYELIGTDGKPTTSLTGILPPYPTDETSMSLLGWTWDRLNPTTAGGANFLTIMRYEYSDSTGEHEAIDVHTMNAETGGAVNDVKISVVTGSSGLTEARLPNGGFVVGYGNGSGDPNNIQLFDANGDAVGTAYQLPSNETNFTLEALAENKVLVEFPAATENGNQLDYDIYSFNPPCYCTGTRIGTFGGFTAVESLAIGDLLVTAAGRQRPVKWIGHRRLDLTKHPDPRAVWPVRVTAGAFGEGLPRRDLWMSPGHNVFVNGVLVAIKHLINGVTVTQERVDAVTYWHVELDGHDVILAEGLPAESYLDTGNRTAFENGGAFLDLHPDFEPRGEAETCAPLVKTGPEVETAKAALLARAQRLGNRTTSAPDLHIMADGRRIEPIDLGGKRLAFYLPAACRSIALTSRTFVPAHVRPRSTDDRVLGVAVKQMRVDGEPVDLRTMAAPGWYKPEEHPSHVRRWTDGSAVLPAGARLVSIDVASEGRYWINQKDNAVALQA